MNIVDTIRAELNLFKVEHLEETAKELTRLVRAESVALRNICSEEITHAHFLTMAYASHPICEVLESEEKDVYLFQIISPAAGSCLGIILGNDTNYRRHIGLNGTTQSNAIIGICTDAVMRALGGELLEVNPLTFRKSILLGEPVLVKIALVKRKKLTFATIIVMRKRDNEIVLKLANLKMTPRK